MMLSLKILLMVQLYGICNALNPVFLFHGVMSDNSTLATIIRRLQLVLFFKSILIFEVFD